MKYRHRPIWIYIGLVGLICAVYGQVGGFDFTSYDDQDYVTQNAHIKSPFSFESLSWAMTTGYAENWHPLTWLSHMLDVRLFGLNSGLHHLTSVFLHAASSMLLFTLLWNMTGAFWRAAFVAAFFALHPLRVESVAWIAERKDTLSTFFWMLALLCYTRYVERPNLLRYLSVLTAFAFGLMSKSVLVTLPFVLLLLDVWPLHRIDRENLRWRIAEKLPMIVMSAVVSVINYNVQQRGGAVISLSLIPLSLRIENALISYAAYLRMLIWPVGLAPIYPFPATIPLWQPIVAGMVLATVSLLVLFRGRSHEYLTVGWFWYLGTLVPVLGLVQVGEQARADRYTYVPLIGVLLMVVWGVGDLRKAHPGLRRAVPVVAVAALIVCIGLSAIQVSYWRNTETLFTHTIAVTENNYKAYNSLGALMLLNDRPADAIQYLSKAIEYKRDFIGAQINIGIALDDLGRPSDALGHFKEAILIDPQNGDGEAGLGVVLAETGAANEGLEHALKAVRLHPTSAHDYFELGRVYGILERLGDSEQAFRESVRLDPMDAQSHFNLGLTLGRQGKLREAEAAFRMAISLKSDYANAWFNLGNALAQQGRLKEAIPAFGEAVRLRPDFADARDAFGSAMDLLRHGG